jgi:tetratricopeptide (TPR) repeat protein
MSDVEQVLALQDQSWELRAGRDFDGAYEACAKALTLIEQAEGPESPDAANLLVELAEIESDRQHFAAARTLVERVLGILDAVEAEFTGEDAANLRVRTLTLLGELCRLSGDYVRSEEALLTGLQLAQAEFGDDSEEAARAGNNLGVLYKFWGRFDDALQLYDKVLRVMTAVFGEESGEAATVWHNIGGVLHARGDYGAAEAPSLRAWTITRSLLGDDHPDTMTDAAAYAAVLDGLGRYDECEGIYRRALEVFERDLGPDHYEVAATLHNLAAVVSVRGDLRQAELLYRRALDIKERILGAGSPDNEATRASLNRLLRA